MKHILFLMVLVLALYASEGDTVMEKVWNTPINTRVEQSVTEIVLPANSEDPITVMDVPKGCSVMIICHWQDFQVSNALGETYNILDRSQDAVNLVKMRDGSPWKFSTSGNLYAKEGPLVLWIRGGASHDITGNVRIQLRLFKPKENR